MLVIPEFPGQTHGFFWNEIASLRRLGVDVLVFSTRRPSVQVSRDWSADAERITVHALPIGWWRLAKSVLANAGPLLRGTPTFLRLLVEVAREGGFEIFRAVAALLAVVGRASDFRERDVIHVHAHSLANSAYLAIFLSRMLRVSCSGTLHSAITTFGPCQNVKWSAFDFGFAVSNAVLLELRELVPAARGCSIDVVSMGVDPEIFRRSESYVPPEPSGQIRLVSCGRLHFGKAHDDVIRALAQLVRAGLDVRLTVIGDGPEREGLAALAGELGIVERVTFTGAMASTQVRSVLEASHVFVSASLDEAIGVAIMEAMAMELPVVVSHVGGVPELVRHGVDGILVPPRAPDKIYAAVMELVRSPTDCVRFGKSSRQRIAEGYTSDRSARFLADRIKLTANA